MPFLLPIELMNSIDKIVIITKKTAYEELLERFNTASQAKFYIEHMGGSFAEYAAAHDVYRRSMERVRHAVPAGMRSQEIDREFLPTFTFGPNDMVVTVGPDGLVVNTAKYLDGQPLVAINPDPIRIDGVLVPFIVNIVERYLPFAIAGALGSKCVSMAKATLNDGQTIYAVNDLFIGQRTHVSARYRLKSGQRGEDQSSSGVIVSTGAGSTGWLRSVVTGAVGITQSYFEEEDVDDIGDDYRFPWDADYLRYSVREPFVSRTSAAGLIYGRIDAREPLELTSFMPQNGVIFSDGVEADYIDFNSGAIAKIGVAEKKLRLVTH